MDEIESNPNYIVSNEILEQKGMFTLDDIFKKVKNRLLDRFQNSNDNLLMFIREKIITLCEVKLVSDTGLYFYVND